MDSFSDYRILLWEEFRKRNSIRSSYSLRAFARDLQVSPSRLSEVFQRKNGLSVLSADRIGSKLWPNDERGYFFRVLVESEHARSAKQRGAARRELESRFKKGPSYNVPREEFLLVSSWIHFAIIELMNLKGFELSSLKVAESLNISIPEAADAIGRLKKLGWIVPDATGWKTKTCYRTFRTEVPSKAARHCHRNLIGRAEASIERQCSSERDLHSLIIAFDPDRLEEAKKTLNDFCRQFNDEFCGGKTPREVYALTLQFFRLTSIKRKMK